MKKSNYIATEFKRMVGKRSVLISVAVVLLVPLLYAMIMLSPKWGPQDNIDNIPIAVVNNDIGAKQDGEIVHIGNELMENLEGNPTLGWDFVSAEAADNGMDKMKYYMKIEVPEDFSEKAIGVMDDNPEKPELMFVQNEGLHYMAATVTNSAIDTIKSQLSDQITETYVRTVFDQVGESAEGFADAADGAKQINEGTDTAKDGTEEMKSSLVEKSGDISKLADGSRELNEGTLTLRDTLAEKYPDITKLAAGAKELNVGTGELLGNLNEKAPDISKLASGSKELNAGTGELLGNLNEKSDDVSKLADGANEVNAGTGLLLSTLNEKSRDITKLSDGASELSGGASQIADGAVELSGGAGELSDGANKLSKGGSDLASGAGELKKGSGDLAAGAKEAGAGSSKLKEGLDNQLVPGSQQLAVGVQQAKEGVNDSIESMYALKDGLEQLKNAPPGVDKIILEEILRQLNASLEGTDEKKESLNQLVAGANQLRDGLGEGSEFNQGLIALNSGLGDLEAGANQLTAGASQLEDGANEISGGSKELAGGAKELATGSDQLKAGSKELEGGANQVADGTKTVRGGWTDLQNNVGTLHDGTTQVAEGNQTVKSGWGDLQDGATQLHDGSSQVSDGNQTVMTGWRDLQDGATQLNDGSTQVADGNQTVMTGWKDLSSGATDLHDGSTQISVGNATVKEGWATLTDGVTQLDDGILQLKDGSGELHEGLAEGAETAGAVDPQEDNIKMFASPVALNGEVINSFQFYRDANAPYVITLALFVGVLAMSFVVPFRRPEILPPSGITWFSGKLLKLAALATSQALIISIYSLLVLQVQVQSSLMFILFSIWVSLTFLMIVLFLVVLAGNIGRFIALAFAILQLSTTGAALPIHMLPEGLRNLSTFLPFTYSIDGFKNIITLGSISTVWSNIGVLFIYLALFGILSAVVFFIRYQKVSEEMEREDEADESRI